MSPIIVTVTPALNPDWCRASASRGQLFDGRVDHLLVVARSSQPVWTLDAFAISMAMTTCAGLSKRVGCDSFNRSPGSRGKRYR
jgi:hypothetical protein